MVSVQHTSLHLVCRYVIQAEITPAILTLGGPSAEVLLAWCPGRSDALPVTGSNVYLVDSTPESNHLLLSTAGNGVAASDGLGIAARIFAISGGHVPPDLQGRLTFDAPAA